MDNNYNMVSIVVGDMESELTKLRLENKALHLLLREHLKKYVFRNNEDETEASLAQTQSPKSHNNNSTVPEIPPPAPTQTEVRIAEKAKAIQITTPEISVVTQRQSVFDRIS